MAKLLGESPRLVPVLLQRVFGLELPSDAEIVPAPEIIRDVRAPDLIVDGAIVVVHDDPEHAEAIAVEVQRAPDQDKRMSWPVHVAGLRRRLGCPVTLLVVTSSRRTARWASTPIDLGRGRMVLHPLVVGPDRIPRILDPDDAREHPELATLGVIVHGRKSGSFRLGQIAIEAVLDLARHDAPRATLLFDIIVAFLGPRTRRRLEKTMGLSMDVPFSTFAKRHYFRGVEHGEISGRARSLQFVLESRGLEISEAQRDYIEGCRDPEELKRWLERAATSSSVDEVLARVRTPRPRRRTRGS